MTCEFFNDAELHQAIIQKLGLRKIGNETFYDDRTGQTYSPMQLSHPTPRGRGILYEELREAVITSRLPQD
jgi:hypothetical protein